MMINPDRLAQTKIDDFMSTLKKLIKDMSKEEAQDFTDDYWIKQIQDYGLIKSPHSIRMVKMILRMDSIGLNRKTPKYKKCIYDLFQKTVLHVDLVTLSDFLIFEYNINYTKDLQSYLKENYLTETILKFEKRELNNDLNKSLSIRPHTTKIKI